MSEARLPVVILRDLVPFPGMVIPISVGRPASVRAVARAVAADGRVILAVQADPAVESLDQAPELQPVAVIGQLVRTGPLERMPVQVVVGCNARVGIDAPRIEEDGSFTVEPATLEIPPVDPARASEAEALIEEVRGLIEKLGDGESPALEPLLRLSPRDPGVFADLIALLPDAPSSGRITVLVTLDPLERLRAALGIVAHLAEVADVRARIAGTVRDELDRNTRQAILREQMRAIQKELGDDADELAKLRERIEALDLPDAVRERAERELGRLATIPSMSPEVGIIRGYLDWLIGLPWSAETVDRLDPREAARILDEDHEGLEKIKERIVEFLAVRSLSPDIRGPILCFVGPPGVGKTSLGRSIARAMDRRFVRLALGGVNDEAEVRGHRRTYIGAMPGRIISTMTQAGTRNPVFLLDELDKMGVGFRGDPAAALLEVLDPEQNGAFSDHYLEVPYDLSRVLFIATANLAEGIPGPLRDRLELIGLSGYTTNEKRAIAMRHLLPRARTNNGLPAEQPAVDEATVERVITEYTHEAGVRSLERQLSTVMRRVARRVAEGAAIPEAISEAEAAELLGRPLHRHDALDEPDAVGVATGLAVTEAGGDVLSVEASLLPVEPGLILTGQLGDVMRESARAALSYLQVHRAGLGIEAEAFSHGIHVHVPAGAIPKDGPSAGITMAVAMASTMSLRPVRRDVAMTGEITLRGRVEPIGGVKAKVLAAHRAGARTVILPAANEGDADEIPPEVRDEIELRFVRTVGEVFDAALLPASPAPAEAERTLSDAEIAMSERDPDTGVDPDPASPEPI